jgi:hypothetical protein
MAIGSDVRQPRASCPPTGSCTWPLSGVMVWGLLAPGRYWLTVAGSPRKLGSALVALWALVGRAAERQRDFPVAGGLRGALGPLWAAGARLPCHRGGWVRHPLPDVWQRHRTAEATLEGARRRSNLGVGGRPHTTTNRRMPPPEESDRYAAVMAAVTCANAVPVGGPVVQDRPVSGPGAARHLPSNG